MKPSALSLILTAIFGAATKIVPFFVHNPVSQEIEAVILTTAEGLLITMGALSSAPAPAPVAPATPKPNVAA